MDIQLHIILKRKIFQFQMNGMMNLWLIRTEIQILFNKPFMEKYLSNKIIMTKIIKIVMDGL